MQNHSVVLLFFFGFWLELSAQEYNVKHGLSSINEVFEPVVVGKPPANAATGLVLLESGEIRHYPFGADPDGSHFYTYSLDSGLTWHEQRTFDGHVGADYQSPISGEYIRVFSQKGIGEGIFCAKSEGGIDGDWTIIKMNDFYCEALRNPIFIESKQRILVPGSRKMTYDILDDQDSAATILANFPADGRNPDFKGSMSFYSDDDGLTWKHSDWVSTPDFPVSGDEKSPRSQNNFLEPTVVELKDGRLWMIARTASNHFYESYSQDFGESWSKPVPSRFYGSITMPTILRLKDGRLLYLWCNTKPLPQGPAPMSVKYYIHYRAIIGIRSIVLTNRDVIHAAISDDDGKTWIGFRELYLNVQRNRSDYARTGGVDRSVHQTQAIELGNDKVLVSCGQNQLHRVIFAFDVNWLYEKERHDDFSQGLKDWSVHQYISGEHGHAALDRTAGASLVDDPENKANKVLKVCNPMNPNLLIENQGAVWNFPIANSGEFITRIYLTEGFKGGLIALLDRWVNPVDTTAYKYSMFKMDIPPSGKINEDITLKMQQWHELTFRWEQILNEEEVQCTLFIDGKETGIGLPLNFKTLNGICYVHFQSRAPIQDNNGFLVGEVHARKYK